MLDDSLRFQSIVPRAKRRTRLAPRAAEADDFEALRTALAGADGLQLDDAEDRHGVRADAIEGLLDGIAGATEVKGAANRAGAAGGWRGCGRRLGSFG